MKLRMTPFGSQVETVAQRELQGAIQTILDDFGVVLADAQRKFGECWYVLATDNTGVWSQC